MALAIAAKGGTMDDDLLSQLSQTRGKLRALLQRDFAQPADASYRGLGSVVGTPGGLNLTPPPEMVQDMETRFGCLVAVHPSSGQYEYFTMHETRIGQKIRRTPP